MTLLAQPNFDEIYAKMTRFSSNLSDSAELCGEYNMILRLGLFRKQNYSIFNLLYQINSF